MRRLSVEPCSPPSSPARPSRPRVLGHPRADARRDAHGTCSANRGPRRPTSSAPSTSPSPTREHLPVRDDAARDLLERHPRHRTAHAALLSDILDVLAGSAPPADVRTNDLALQADLTESELRVLRYLPSNLSAPEIASELYVSTSTVKTHMLHIYAEARGAPPHGGGRTRARARAADAALRAPPLAADHGSPRAGRRSGRRTAISPDHPSGGRRLIPPADACRHGWIEPSARAQAARLR